MMPPFTDTPEFPLWVLIFERIGPGSAILVFTGAVLWHLLPSAKRLIGARQKLSEATTRVLPQLVDGVKDAVTNIERIADHVTGTPRASTRNRRSTDVRGDRDDPVVSHSGSVGVDSSE